MIQCDLGRPSYTKSKKENHSSSLLRQFTIASHKMHEKIPDSNQGSTNCHSRRCELILRPHISPQRDCRTKRHSIKQHYWLKVYVANDDNSYWTLNKFRSNGAVHHNNRSRCTVLHTQINNKNYMDDL